MEMTPGEESDRHSEVGRGAVAGRPIGRRAALLSAALIGTAQAQGSDWPTRPVRLIVAFGAGGAADTATRALAGSMAQRLGQGVVVENRTGGNSVIAGSATVQAPRDGYTFLVDAANQLTNPLLIADLPFDYATAFTPVTQITRFPQVIAVRRDFPAQTIEAFIDHARRHPETVTYGTPPAAGMAHLAGALFQRRAGIRLVHVPYRAATDAARDVAAGNLDAVLLTTSTIRPAYEAGMLRILAMTSAQRITLYPDVPTLAESGLPGFDMDDWQGMFAARGTPEPLIDRMQALVRDAARDPAVLARVQPIGVDLIGSSRQAFLAFLDTQRSLVGRLIQEDGIRLG